MKLKKYYPFIFPTIALLLVLFLAFRWYNLRTQRSQEDQQNQVQIENLTEEEVEGIVKGTEDVETVDLEGGATASGQIRYDIRGEKALFSVNASLEELDQGLYQVWLRKSGSEKLDKAFVLQYGKGGYMGSASVSVDDLPLEVVVSKEIQTEDKVLEEELLRGMIEAE
ncbi:MAG: hypothetical protein U9O78_00700 [Patescibacteria group bacterium]|nr:hypothetical protein [Patescibacteria group bacterium]